MNATARPPLFVPLTVVMGAYLWNTFVKNLWHVAVASFLLGTAIGVIGFRGLRALRTGAGD